MTAQCWECEAQSGDLRTVTLRDGPRDIGTVLLCPVCYHGCYLPLDRGGSGVLHVETRDVADRRR
jgi:hypothetical protein